MRISDWSSDVCSSDLRDRWSPSTLPRTPAFEARWTPERDRGDGAFAGLAKEKTRLKGCPAGAGFRRRRPHTPPPPDPPRSEEHTSELQYLIRKSSAAFCLSKTKHPIPNKTQNHKH